MLPSEGATSTTTRKRHHLTPVCCVCGVRVCALTHLLRWLHCWMQAEEMLWQFGDPPSVTETFTVSEYVTDWMSYRRAMIQTHIIPPIHPFSYNRRPSTLTTITIRSHPWQGDGLCRQTDRQTDIDWSLRGRVTYLLTNWAIVNHRRLPKLVKP